MTIQISSVRSIEECDDCRLVAARIWGEPAACSTPQMWVHSMYGGVVLIARDRDRPIGFLLSFPALYRGRLVLWSHETGILPEYLHQGIGRQMKDLQRARALALGYSEIAWTFDPLVARNAYFNIRKLRAEIHEYKINVYGTDDTDLINQGIETDRWVALWPVHGSQRVSHAEGTGEAQSVNHRITLLKVRANGRPEAHDSDDVELRADTYVITEIPAFFEANEGDIELRTEWRISFRQVAIVLMQRGYQPVEFVRNDKRPYYIWRQRGEDGRAN